MKLPLFSELMWLNGDFEGHGIQTNSKGGELCFCHGLIRMND